MFCRCRAVTTACGVHALDALHRSAHHLGREEIRSVCRMVRPLALVFVLALTLAGSPARADDMLIVPGKRVGAVSVGMSRAQVEKVLGAASSTSELSPHRTNA